MVQVNRRERRASSRKPIFVGVLLAVVALFSFGIGFMAGRSSAPVSSPVVVSTTEPQSIAVPVPDPSIQVVEEKVEEDKLTFFEALPKGEEQPLGTGINMPNEETDPVAAKIAQQPDTNAPAPIQSTTGKVVPVAKPAQKVTASADASYELQISSFKSPDDAGILLRRLEKKGYRPYIEQANLGSKGVWYRVFLGPYASQDKAQTAALSLKVNEKLESLVRKKR
jgi:cell division septation protein DedD